MLIHPAKLKMRPWGMKMYSLRRHPGYSATQYRQWLWLSFTSKYVRAILRKGGRCGGSCGSHSSLRIESSPKVAPLGCRISCSSFQGFICENDPLKQLSDAVIFRRDNPGYNRLLRCVVTKRRCDEVPDLRGYIRRKTASHSSKTAGVAS